MSPLLVLAAATLVAGAVFDDADGDGRRGAAEKGLAGVLVSDGTAVTVTAVDGGFRLDAAGRNVFVVVPGDRRATSGFWKPTAARVDFALAPDPAPEEWVFAHLSDTHVQPENVERMRRALGLATDRRAALAVITGDLNKDALRVPEATARARFGLYAETAARAPLPVFSVPGNHDIFGIERHLSLVPATHPAYGRALYEEILGPRYYAFWRGKVHFIVLDTLGIDDLWYYGHLDDDLLAWLERHLAHVPAGATVVTAGHVPLRTGAFSSEFETDGPGRTLQTVNGHTFHRHVVRNGQALLERLKPFRFTLALQGHSHQGERLHLWDAGETRYHTAPAVDRTPGLKSGFFLYRVKGAAIDDGEIVPLDD